MCTLHLSTGLVHPCEKSVTMRSTLLLLTLVCIYCCVEGGNLHHAKGPSRHHGNKREKISRHHSPTHLQKKSEHHSNYHHVPAEKKEASDLAHESKRTAKTMDVEKVKRFLARILKSVETPAKHIQAHNKKVSEKTKRHLNTVHKKRVRSQKVSDVKHNVDEVKRASVDETRKAERETKIRNLIHAVVSKLNHKRHLQKRQDGSTTESSPTESTSAGSGSTPTDQPTESTSAGSGSTPPDPPTLPTESSVIIDLPTESSPDGDCCCEVMDVLLEHLETFLDHLLPSGFPYDDHSSGYYDSSGYPGGHHYDSYHDPGYSGGYDFEDDFDEADNSETHYHTTDWATSWPSTTSYDYWEWQ